MPGRGGGPAVSMLAFYSNDPNSNPIDSYSFFCKFVIEKNHNKQKEAGVGSSSILNLLKYDPEFNLTAVAAF